MKQFLSALALIAALPAGAAPLNDSGLHDVPWIRDTFLDLREDLAEAEAEGRRMMLIVEQRGCIYCTRMHEEVWPQPEIAQLLDEQFFVVRLNMFGDLEVTDFDGTTLSEKDAVRRWSVLFTPTIMFFPETPDAVPQDATAATAAVVTMPGAFGKWTTLNLLGWVLAMGYEGDEPFQKYHARMIETQTGGE